MNLKVKTEVLKELVGKAEKGASNNKLLPITQMLAIRCEAGTLTVVSTDATNYLYVKERGVDSDDFYAVVPVTQFAKLVSRLSCDSVAFEIGESDFMTVRGNGTYKIPMQYDEDGSLVQFPDPLSGFEPEATFEMQRSTISRFLTLLKPALALTMENPQYTGYYVGDKAVATDSFMINLMDVKLFDTPRLISAEVMDLLALMGSEKINVELSGNAAVFTSPDCTVYGVDLEGIEDYDFNSILSYADGEFPSMCKVSKAGFLRMLERLSLFVTEYDEGGVRFTFTRDGLCVSSAMSSGVEVLPYTESVRFSEFGCVVNVDMMIRQVKAQAGDTVEIWYGDENVLKLVDGNVTQIIALLEENGEEEG